TLSARHASIGAETSDDVEHAWRHTGLSSEPGNLKSGAARELRWFHNNGASARQREGNLFCENLDWKVPRHDDADHANRFAEYQAGLLRREIRVGLAMKLRR